MADAALRAWSEAAIAGDYARTGDWAKYAFDRLDAPPRAMRSLQSLLGWELARLCPLLGMIKPCLYEAHGEPPGAAVEFHQLAPLGRASAMGWAVACYRGATRCEALHPRFWGGWCDGIAVISRDLRQVIGWASPWTELPFIGNPAWIFDEDFAPARVFRTPREWLLSGGEGVALCGARRVLADWLRGCEAGIIADNIKHGEELQQMIRREMTGPQILVAA